jgi:glycosyltransferase involved in cell wall biosynthesis
MTISSNLRFLEIGRDPWIGRSFSADFLPLGRSIVPGDRIRKFGLISLIVIIWRLVRRRYDIIALGPLQVQRTIGLGRGGRLAKKCISAIARSATLADLVRRALCGSRTRIVVLDIDDSPIVSEAALAIFRPMVYFKRNLSRNDFESGKGFFQVLPMAVEPFPAQPIPKDSDIFICGGYITEARKAALQAARALVEKGWKVDMVEHPIPYQEYRRRVFSARTVFAFQGCGFHTWRMYEAAAAKAVPIIDSPDSDTIHDFVDGENCLVVGPAVEMIVLKVDEFLGNRALVDTAAKAAYRLAMKKHTLTSCARSLVAEVERALKPTPRELSERSRRWDRSSRNAESGSSR